MSKTLTERTRKAEEYEVAKEVKVYQVTMPCSECDGEMVFTGQSYCTYPPYNIHKCNKCGREEEFHGVTYPKIEYR